MKTYFHFGIFLLSLFTASNLNAQKGQSTQVTNKFTLSGIVKDEVTGQVLQGASIYIADIKK